MEDTAPWHLLEKKPSLLERKGCLITDLGRAGRLLENWWSAHITSAVVKVVDCSVNFTTGADLLDNDILIVFKTQLSLESLKKY